LRIFIAGGSGVLGRALIPLLHAAGHEVTATTRSATRAHLVARLGAAPVVVEALDRDAVRDAVAHAGPEVIVHLLTDLSTGDSASNAALRVAGTRNLVDAALETGTSRVVAESISWVYPAGPTLATEADPLDPDLAEPRRTTITAVSALESVVGEVPEHVVLRYGRLYGPDTWYSREGRSGQEARAARLTATETVASFVHTADAARAALLALEWPSGIWNIVDDDPAAGSEWVPRFADALGAPEPATAMAGDVGRPVSNTRAHAAGLVLRYPSWREGFRTL
jgi:nucleoside-diphosphate-sugar epimerase